MGYQEVSDRLRSLSSLVYRLICAFGCFYQIKSVTDSYFSYAITTQVRVNLPSQLPLPALSICFRISDVFNYEAFGKTLSQRANVTNEQIDEEITIADAFRFTPSNKLIVSCIYRTPKSYDFHQINGSGCSELFNVTNFYLQEYLCYRIRMVKFDKQEYSYRAAAFALSNAGLLYSVSYNISTFEKALFMKIIVNEADSRPFRSSAYTSPVARLYNEKTQLARYNYFSLTYYTVHNYFLSAPYKTNCIDYSKLGFRDAEDCIKKCLTNSSIAVFDRYPYSVLEEERLQYKIFNSKILKRNATVSKLLYRMERKCHSKCNKLGCVLSYTITQVTKDPNNDVMTFNVLIPQLPSYTIKFRPKMQFLEYFIYVVSCFGTWFGLSVLSLNPFKKSIWMPEKQAEEQAGSRRPANVFKQQTDHYNKSCVYCSQTRIILISEVKQRLQLVVRFMSTLKQGRDVGTGSRGWERVQSATSKSGGLIYSHDNHVTNPEVEKTFSYPLDLRLDYVNQRIVVTFGQRDGIRVGYSVLSINGKPLNGRYVDGQDVLDDVLRSETNYPISIRFGIPKLTANEKIVLASMFHSMYAIAAIQLSGNKREGSKHLPPASTGIELLETENFRLNCFQTLTGVKFIVISDFTHPSSTKDTFLKRLYEIYADYALKNPFYSLDMPIRCELFDENLKSILEQQEKALITSP